jgi:hypothetical protein
VALVGDSHPQVPDNGWPGAFEGLIDRYAEGDEARAARRNSGEAPGDPRTQPKRIDAGVMVCSP